MKIKVLKPFRDKHKKIVYRKGKIITISKERFAEIVANLGDDYIEVVPEDKPKNGKKTKSGAS